MVKPGIMYAQLTVVSYSVNARLAMYAHAWLGNTLLGLKTWQLKKWIPLCVYSSSVPTDLKSTPMLSNTDPQVKGAVLWVAAPL